MNEHETTIRNGGGKEIGRFGVRWGGSDLREKKRYVAHRSVTKKKKQGMAS